MFNTTPFFQEPQGFFGQPLPAFSNPAPTTSFFGSPFNSTLAFQSTTPTFQQPFSLPFATPQQPTQQFSFPDPQPQWNIQPQPQQQQNGTTSMRSGGHENSKVSTMNLKDRKARLLNRCLKQVKDNRGHVLQKLREGTLTARDLKSNLQLLIQAEENQENMSMDGDVNKLAVLETLEGEEYAEIMTFLEEALFEGIRQEERKQLEEYYEELHKCEEELLVQDAESIHHALETCYADTEEPLVICPVCKKNKLLATQQVIFCACGLRVDTKQDHIGLDYVRTRLCELFQLHGAQCDGELKFSCTKETFGVPAMLYMNCTQCPCNEIVL